MKSYFFLSLLIFLCEANPGFSQADLPSSFHKSSSPSVTLPPSDSFDLTGRDDFLSSNGQLDCSSLLHRNWAHQSGQSAALCNEAEASCVRYGLLQQLFMAKKNKEKEQQHYKKRFDWDTLTQGLAASLGDVKLKLLGCAVAIEAMKEGSGSLLEKSGFAPPSSGR